MRPLIMGRVVVQGFPYRVIEWPCTTLLVCPLPFDEVNGMHKECLRPFNLHQNGQKYY